MKTGFFIGVFLVCLSGCSLVSERLSNADDLYNRFSRVTDVKLSNSINTLRDAKPGQWFKVSAIGLAICFSRNKEPLMESFIRRSPRIKGALIFFGFQRAPEVVEKKLNVTGQEQPDDTYAPLWWGIILVLLILSLYLLLKIKTKEAMGEKIKVLESELAVLYDNAPCGYFSMGDSGIFLNVNQTLVDWLGYQKHEMVSKLTLADIIDGTEAVVRDVTSDLNNLRAPARIEFHLVKKTGERIPVIVSPVNTGGISQDPTQRLFSVIDHSECHQALERIRNLDQELEAFSYSISHDLRAPLRSIDGYSKILEEDYARQLNEEGRRVLNVIMSNAKRMGKLIDDLLDFARLGRASMQKSLVDMTAMVNGIVQELVANEPNRRIDFKVGTLQAATADADMIRQAWLNLIENAIKFTGKKDLAVIEVRSYNIDNTEICYEVRDNGVGFDMKYAHKLFGVFQRLHKMQDFSGTGVGLAIVKRIISRHGGRVWVEGSLQKGAIFYFTLPFENANS